MDVTLGAALIIFFFEECAVCFLLCRGRPVLRQPAASDSTSILESAPSHLSMKLTHVLLLALVASVLCTSFGLVWTPL